MEVKGVLSLDIPGAGASAACPAGASSEYSGPEKSASGKTDPRAARSSAEAQKAGGGGGVRIDAEHALDPVYAKALGVDVDSLLVSQPDTGEQALEIAEALVRSGAIECVVVDFGLLHSSPRARSTRRVPPRRPAVPVPCCRRCRARFPNRTAWSFSTISFAKKVGIVYGNPDGHRRRALLKSTFCLHIRKSETIKSGRTSSEPCQVQGGQEQGRAALQHRPSSTSSMRGISKESAKSSKLARKLGIVKRAGREVFLQRLEARQILSGELLVSTLPSLRRSRRGSREKLSEVKLESEWTPTPTSTPRPKGSWTVNDRPYRVTAVSGRVGAHGRAVGWCAPTRYCCSDSRRATFSLNRGAGGGSVGPPSAALHPQAMDCLSCDMSGQSDGPLRQELASSVLVWSRGYGRRGAERAAAESFYHNKCGDRCAYAASFRRGSPPEDVAAALEPLEVRPQTGKIYARWPKRSFRPSVL